MKKTNHYNPYAWILGEPTIGEDTWIGAFTLIDAKHAKLMIGKGCNISTGAQIITHSTVHRCISEGKYTTIDSADTVIEDFCFIGSNAVVMMGCRIGHHSDRCRMCCHRKHDNSSLLIVAGVPGKIVGSAKI